MRPIVAILLFLFLPFTGCTNRSVSNEKVGVDDVASVLMDQLEANQMALYNATAANRNALQEEANFCAPTTNVRVLTNRNRVVNHQVTIRQALMQTHRPAVKNLIHHSVVQLVAFPKETYVFRLRRILV